MNEAKDRQVNEGEFQVAQATENLEFLNSLAKNLPPVTVLKIGGISTNLSPRRLLDRARDTLEGIEDVVLTSDGLMWVAPYDGMLEYAVWNPRHFPVTPETLEGGSRLATRLRSDLANLDKEEAQRRVSR